MAIGAGYGQVEKPGEPNVASSLDAVFMQNSSLLERQAAVRNLGRGLEDDEYSALLEFLAGKPSDDALPADQLVVLKNEVVNKLKNQERDPAELIRSLIAMFGEATQDEVWRDYCIQHLGTLYKAAQGTDRERVRKLFFQATELKQGSIPGTALIALANNAGPDIASQAIADKALAIAEDTAYGDAARITALQIAAKQNDARILSVARETAFGSAGAPLRVSAIAVLGMMGDKTDLTKLEPLANSTDIRLRTAAAAAVKKLRGPGY